MWHYGRSPDWSGIAERWTSIDAAAGVKAVVFAGFSRRVAAVVTALESCYTMGMAHHRSVNHVAAVVTALESCYRF